MGKLPKNPKKGSIHSVKTKRGVMRFQATGKQGFGMWKIVGKAKK